MIVVGDYSSGKQNLVRALAGTKFKESCLTSDVIDTYALHVSDNDLTFAQNNENMRVWVLGSNKFLPLQSNLISQDTLTLMVIDGARPTRAPKAIEHWTKICKSLGITKWLTVFTKADKADYTSELRKTIPGSFYVSSLEKNKDLDSLRKTIIARASESKECWTKESSMLINALKVLSQIDYLGVSQIVRIAHTFGLETNLPKDERYLDCNIFTSDVFHKLLKEYSTFISFDNSSRPLCQTGQCQVCYYKRDTVFVETSVGQCNGGNHSCTPYNLHLTSEKLEIVDIDTHYILSKLLEINVLHKIKLPNKTVGYFLPNLSLIYSPMKRLVNTGLLVRVELPDKQSGYFYPNLRIEKSAIPKLLEFDVFVKVELPDKVVYVPKNLWKIPIQF